MGLYIVQSKGLRVRNTWFEPLLWLLALESEFSEI